MVEVTVSIGKHYLDKFWKNKRKAGVDNSGGAF